MSHQDTQTVEKIIKIAENNFAQHGFFASSLRHITREAGVNVAAIHYHFGSKEALFLEVLNRRIVPFVKDFSHQLDLAKRTRNLQIEDVVASYATVIIGLVQSDEEGAIVVTRLVSRMLLDDYKIFRQDLAQKYADLTIKLHQMLCKLLPQLDEETVKWRMHIAITTLFNAFAGNNVLNALALSKNTITARDPLMVSKYVVPFVVAGLKV